MSKKCKAAERPVLSVKSTRRAIVLFLILVFWAATQTLLIGQEPVNHSPSIDLTGIKCIVSGVQNAQPQFKVEFKAGTVYFSNQQAANQFRMWSSPKRMRASLVEEHVNLLIVKAHHQLVLTEQYVQTHCPITGEPVNNETDNSEVNIAQTSNETDSPVKLRLGGISIAFHDQAAAQAFSDQASLVRRAPLVFGEKNFNRTFAAAKPTVAWIAQGGSTKNKK